MAYILVYTRKGEEIYDSGHPDNYPGHVGKNCDVFDAMHLAVSRDGKDFIPMRNNTGVLFPRADLTEKVPGGITKTLIDPWVFRMADGSFGVCAVRRNQNAPDPKSTGCMMLFTSRDLVRYEEKGFLKLAEEEIRHPRCRWDESGRTYYLEWETEEGIFSGRTGYFMEVDKKERCEKASLLPAKDFCLKTDPAADALSGAASGIVPGNVMEISGEEADRIEKYLGRIRHVGVEDITWSTKAGEKPDFSRLPGAVCLYSDGSVHEKPVSWDREAFDSLDFSEPGEYEISGRIRQKHYPFPFLDCHISDPCVHNYHGRYFLSSSGQRSVIFRESDTLEGLAEAAPFTVYAMPESDTEHANMWAPELHEIHGVPYVFTTVGGKNWTTVRSHVLRCDGDPADPSCWEAPRLVLRPDGRELQENGISLDMTYFCVDGVHYVMWSDRVFEDRDPDRPVMESADIYIAAVDPDAPWQLVTEPVCILKPIYGWDRCETEVDEGPYLLRRGDDLFITISGSSTGLGDLYCLGLLHARRGNNLLSPEGWDWLPYPILTRESVPGEYGPGHNSFVKDPETGDDLMIYHAIPHEKDGKTLGRRMAIRRVHWAASGYPYLEMTEQEDLDPARKQVTLKIIIK